MHIDVRTHLVAGSSGASDVAAVASAGHDPVSASWVRTESWLRPEKGNSDSRETPCRPHGSMLERPSRAGCVAGGYIFAGGVPKVTLRMFKSGVSVHNDSRTLRAQKKFRCLLLGAGTLGCNVAESKKIPAGQQRHPRVSVNLGEP